MFNKSELEFCTLSGTNEIGRNCSFVKYNNDILVVDAGLSFPDQEMYGIDYLIPNVSHLKKYKRDIKGILLTHGHLDHIGALPYILEDLGFPTIYAGPFAIAILMEKLKEFRLEKKVRVKEIARTSKFKIGVFDVEYIANTHSIPDSFSIFINSPKGSIFFSGDYKLDEETNIEDFKQLAGRIDIALLESTNAYKPGKALSERVVAQSLEALVRKHSGRVIVSAFASLVSRLKSMVEIAKMTNRKIVLAGRSLNTTMGIALQYGYIKADDSLFIEEKDISKYPDNQLIFLVTGSQAERYAALNRIALNEHKSIKIKKGDVIIMSSSEIPENVAKIERMTDKLIRLGAELIKNGEEDVHSSGHGLQEDMKMMYEYLKPKYVMPVHGSLTFRYQNKKNYVGWGHPSDLVELTDDGQTWFFDGAKLRRGKKIESKPILIDGLGVGDIGDIVLKDRKQLSQYGMFVIILNLSAKNKHILGSPRFISRGFVYMKNSQQLLREINNIIMDTHRKWLAVDSRQKDGEQLLIDAIERSVASYILKKTEREPIILPVII